MPNRKIVNDTVSTITDNEYDAINQLLGNVKENGIWIKSESDIVIWRKTAFVMKEIFITNAYTTGIISQTEAEEAIVGWPTLWNTFFTNSPPEYVIRTKALWARIERVYRNDPIIHGLKAYKNLTDEQLDALFI